MIAKTFFLHFFSIISSWVDHSEWTLNIKLLIVLQYCTDLWTYWVAETKWRCWKKTRQGFKKRTTITRHWEVKTNNNLSFFLNPLSTDFPASWGLKVSLRTQRAISQPLLALPPRSSHCASDDKSYNAKPFQMPKIHGPEWRKSGSENWNRKTNRSWSVEPLWSSFFHWSTAWILAVICCIHYKPFRVTIAIQWAKPRPRVTFLDRSCPKSIRWVSSNSCSVVISRPIFKNKVSTFR